MTTQQPAAPSTAWEQAIADGIARQMLEPRVISFYTDGNGNQVPQYAPSPLAQLAEHLWTRKQAEILAAVIDTLDIDVFAAQVAKKVIDKLSPHSSFLGNWENEGYRNRIHGAVDDKVAAALAEETLARIRATREQETA